MNKKNFFIYCVIVFILVLLIIAGKIQRYAKETYFKAGAFWMWATIEKNHYYPAPFEITYRAALLEYHKAEKEILRESAR